MNRLRRWSVFALLCVPMLLWSARDPSARKKQPDGPPAEKWLVDHTLTVRPAGEPALALKYRLFPLSTERREGNAVPMYLRFAHERPDAVGKQLQEKPAEWNKLPLNRLPVSEVKDFLRKHSYILEQLDLGARRKTADWSYSLDAPNPIGLRLGDTQEMRMYPPLLVLQARVAIVEGRHADAIRTLQTGFSFSQQINQAPLLVSALVGLAAGHQFASCLLELIEQPSAPNLYWALAVIPRPLIDLRRGFEMEQRFIQMQFPDMDDLKRPRSAQEWDAALKRIRKGYEQLHKDDPKIKPPRAGNAPDDPASKSPDLPVARKYLTEVVGMRASEVDKLPPAGVLLQYLSHLYDELRDEVFKGTYLPFPQAQSVLAQAQQRLKSVPDTEAARLILLFLPANLKVQLAQMRLERKLAALQAIEALRMHAAGNGGKLPDKLDQVKVVPVPPDPGTGKPLEYQRDGQTATLISRIPGEPLAANGLRFRVTMRK